MYQDLSKHIHVLYTTGHKDPDPRPHPLGILWYPFFFSKNDTLAIHFCPAAPKKCHPDRVIALEKSPGTKKWKIQKHSFLHYSKRTFSYNYFSAMKLTVLGQNMIFESYILQETYKKNANQIPIFSNTIFIHFPHVMALN